MAKWGKGNLYWQRDQFFASVTAYQARPNNQFMIADIGEVPTEVTNSIQPQRALASRISAQAFSIIGRITPPDEVYGIQISAITNNLTQKEVTASDSFLHRTAQVPQIADEIHGIRLSSITNNLIYKQVARSVLSIGLHPQFVDVNVPIETRRDVGIPSRVLYKRTSNEAFVIVNKLQVPDLDLPQINIQEISRRLTRKVAANSAHVIASRFVVTDLADEALPEGVTLVPHIVYQTPRGVVQSYLIATRLASLEVVFPIIFAVTKDPIILITEIEPVVPNIANNEFYNFDGASGNVKVTDSPAIQNIFDGGGTVELWIYPRSVGQNNGGRLVDKSTNITSGWVVHLESPRLLLIHTFSTTAGQFAVPIMDFNTWTHVSIVYNADSVINVPTIRFNGIAQTVTVEVTPVGTRLTDVGDDVFIGNRHVLSSTFDGFISDVQLWSDARTADEINDNLNSRLAGDEAGLVGYWKFNEGSGLVALDSTSNRNNGTITSATHGTRGEELVTTKDTITLLTEVP